MTRVLPTSKVLPLYPEKRWTRTTCDAWTRRHFTQSVLLENVMNFNFSFVTNLVFIFKRTLYAATILTISLSPWIQFTFTLMTKRNKNNSVITTLAYGIKYFPVAQCIVFFYHMVHNWQTSNGTFKFDFFQFSSSQILKI